MGIRTVYSAFKHDKATLISQAGIQAAFIAIASRIVGSTFRYLETLNPAFQQANVIADPPTVLRREIVTISMAWVLSLATHTAIKRLAGKYPFWGQFFTTIVGTTAAESIGRLVAYRKALKAQDGSSPPPGKSASPPTRDPVGLAASPGSFSAFPTGLTGSRVGGLLSLPLSGIPAGSASLAAMPVAFTPYSGQTPGISPRYPAKFCL